MSSRLPLFPLTTALVPGLVLPLHIFEPRYRELVERLLSIDDPDDREFGIVAVRDGHNADDDGIEALYPVGTAVVMRQVDPREDGRYDIVTTGSRRFRLLSIDTSEPLISAEVEFIDDTADAGDPVLTAAVTQRFEDYRAALSGQVTPADPEETADESDDDPDATDDLPSDPTVLSFLVTAAMVLPTDERQSLLAAGTTDERLLMAAGLLTRETALVRALGAVPAIDPVFTTASAN